MLKYEKIYKYFVTDEELSYLMYRDANNLYEWAMSQKLPLDGFKWEKNIS